MSVEENVDFFARQRRADEALIGNRGYRKYLLITAWPPERPKSGERSSKRSLLSREVSA
jgi:hypothetical protein